MPRERVEEFDAASAGEFLDRVSNDKQTQRAEAAIVLRVYRVPDSSENMTVEAISWRTDEKDTSYLLRAAADAVDQRRREDQASKVELKTYPPIVTVQGPDTEQ